jgi:hypothetical protein
MKKLFALFSVKRNSSSILSFTGDSLSNYALLNIRGGADPTGRSEVPVLVIEKK